MDEGIDDYELDHEFELNENAITQEEQIQESQQEGSQQEESDFISELLKSRGIEDSSKIKFENEDGELEEIDWESLSTKDKLNILNSSEDRSNELNNSELGLINAIRSSNLTPEEYIQYIQRNTINTYVQNMQNNSRNYSVDQYTDEELYVMDLLSKSSEVTEEEAIDALEKAKSNESLFKKQIGAIRNEYKKAEDENIQQYQIQQQEYQQAQLNYFAERIENSIINFEQFSNGQIEMTNEDKQDLYEFILGRDNAGNNWFAKALNDPDTVVQMAWFVLNGEKMIQDIDDYYKSEIKKVREESYKKGLNASKDKSTVAYKPKGKHNVNESFDDLDDF